MRSRVIAVLVAALVPLAAAGCSSDDEPDASPSRTASSSPTVDGPTDATPSDSPSASETGVAPATGAAVQLERSMRFRFPAGESQPSGDGSTTVVGGVLVDGGFFDITASELETSNTELDPLAKASLATRVRQAEVTPGRFGAGPTRSPNRVVNGQEGWVLEGADKKTTFYEFGTHHAGVTVYISFQYPTSHAAGEAWRESVLASIEWK
jgi:hypothetical protein